MVILFYLRFILMNENVLIVLVLVNNNTTGFTNILLESALL